MTSSSMSATRTRPWAVTAANSLRLLAFSTTPSLAKMSCATMPKACRSSSSSITLPSAEEATKLIFPTPSLSVSTPSTCSKPSTVRGAL
ncbi:hypothetical protein CORC01_06234 [Colletotrichum orchidophilum]|uniref:Uncharacterized protein n=1 Tax=Colletotrichum orchidophilum TaxID=1209926 RepID=A0A1G4BAL1_9PEZI|nr:uncharacterized protein CORC01_06234 [Colletotrichum orchidophilum]OHE98443.1 hypothetical protein CORC01_06234 [Colletotrichum orchidophilum]